MMGVVIGVVMIIVGIGLSFLLGPQSRGIYHRDPSWKRLAKEFTAIVVAWILILAGAVILVLGLIDFGNWVLGWL